MYVFKAWTNDIGENKDREHRSFCRWPRCRHYRMGDLNREDGRNIVRWFLRLWPPYFHILVGRSYRTLVRIGRKPWWW